VDFVRVVGDEVVRVETMKVGGQKIVKTEKEVDLGGPAVASAAQQEQHSTKAPSLRRPGEEAPAANGSDTPLPNTTAPLPPKFRSSATK
jgi:hypothetical protein